MCFNKNDNFYVPDGVTPSKQRASAHASKAFPWRNLLYCGFFKNFAFFIDKMRKKCYTITITPKEG